MRKPFTNLDPRCWDCDPWTYCTPGGGANGMVRGGGGGRPGSPILRPGERFRLLFHSSQIESEILLLSVAQNRDVRLTRVTQCAQNLLPLRRIVERRAVDGRHQIARPQAQAEEGLRVAARVHPETLLLAAREHRLRAHDVADDARIATYEFTHSIDDGCDRCGRQARRRRVAVDQVRQRQRFQTSVTLEQHVVGEHGVQPRSARNVVSDRIHFGRGSARPEYCQPIVWIIGGDHTRQDQRHVRLRRIGAVIGRQGRLSEKMRAGDGGDVDRRPLLHPRGCCRSRRAAAHGPHPPDRSESSRPARPRRGRAATSPPADHG